MDNFANAIKIKKRMRNREVHVRICKRLRGETPLCLLGSAVRVMLRCLQMDFTELSKRLSVMACESGVLIFFEGQEKYFEFYSRHFYSQRCS